ncbi:MAG: hypothetical protein ACFHU9_04820 [Fluviicola sp.]
MRWKILLTLVIFGCAYQVSAQTFTPNREKFVKEYQKQVNEFGSKEMQAVVKDKLTPMLLETSDFPDRYFTNMVNTSNQLLEKRFKMDPEVIAYVFSVYSFVDKNLSEASYDAWQSTVDKLIDNRNKDKLSSFLEFSEGFFENGRISESSDFSWYYIGGSYEFEVQKNAVIKFTGGDLVCRVITNSNTSNERVVDSIRVYETTGEYEPALKKWKGVGGKITWGRVGLDPAEHYAELNHFSVSTKRSAFNVDTVSLTTSYVDNTIQGRLSERATKRNDKDPQLYPQFLSFEQNVLIEDVAENIDYIGGFEMKGASFYGTGSEQNPSKIELSKDGKPFIVARAEQIVIDSKRIHIGRAETSLYLNNGDSLYHPGADFTYDLEKKEVQISRTSTGIGQAAFQDKYHQLEIYAPKVVWQEDQDQLIFTFGFETSPEQRMARFESVKFFDERLYDRLQGLSSVHPLVAIANYAYKYDEPTMQAGKAASALGLTKEQATPTLIQLSNLGFINYDTERDLVHVTDKLITFVEAKAGTKDYDNIIFVSDMRPKTPPQLEGKTKMEIQQDEYLSYLDSMFTALNTERRGMTEYATMDLATLKLKIQAVDRVGISQRKNTTVVPEGSEVVIKENRNFDFGGWVFSGKAEINTVAANFTYDDFTIHLLDTKETVFNVDPMKREHGPGPVRMISELKGVSGKLIVDHKNNKSGKNDLFDMYPRLIVENETRIYYNDKSIYRGAYDSTRFYYTVQPFIKDSLHMFVRKDLKLQGELTSAGIFPKMKEELKVMPDYSFGFNTKAPEGGYPFYESEAKYDNIILLSNNGLQGAGKIDFINSTSQTLKTSLFAFLPDSTVGIVDFVNRPSEQGVEFPPVKSGEAYISYVPKEDLLRVRSIPTKELEFFDGESNLRGGIEIRPEGMRGSGLMDLSRATLISDDFSFKRWDIDADTSSFDLKNEDAGNSDEDPLAFNTTNVSAHVSFKDRLGEFNSNEGESRVNFPVNRYFCLMDKFKWYMDNAEIDMERASDKDITIDQGVDLKGPNFYSTDPKQDSLQFMAPKAKFNVRNKVIYCDEVEYIDIADARISPDSMKVVIRKKAKIDKFENATIVANYITKYHKFDQAEVEIKARRDYRASGRYPYYDIDSNVYYVMMDNIRPDTAYQTIASGEVKQEDNFKLSPQFDYYGEMSIAAANPLITFKGATRINHNCDKFDKNWMAFTSEIDPKNIQIPVSEEMQNLNGGSISAGIVWRDSPSTDSLQLYPTFLSALVDPEDPIVMTANGYLQYNPDAKEFQIGSKEKLINRLEVGNFIALHTESCSMNGDGEIKLGMDFGDVEIDAIGVVNYNQNTGETSMNITARMKMELDKGLMEGLAKRINELEGLQRADFNSTTLDQAIRTWEDVQTADNFKADFIGEKPIRKIPKGLNQSMTFSGIRLSSFDGFQTKGLITNVQSAVLVNMYGEPVMKYVPFRAFFQQIHSGAGGDAFNLMIDIPGGNDYYMHYGMSKKDGTLSIISGDSEFTNAINEMKDDKRKTKNFKYQTETDTFDKASFLDLFTQ